MSADPVRRPWPEQELPANWGLDLNVAERDVRAAIREAPFRGKRRPKFALGDFVSLPRPLLRAGLFSRTDTPDPAKELHLELGAGEAWLYGARLSRRELRILAIVSTLAAEPGKRGKPLREIYLPPGRLAQHTSASDNAAQIQKARGSLARFCAARVALDIKGLGRVGVPGRPEPLMLPDPRSEDTYVLAPWLSELLRRGYSEPKSGLLEKGISWPLLRTLNRGPLLLYAFLECENWRAEGLHLDPARRSDDAPRVLRRILELSGPLMRILDLDELAPVKQRAALRNALAIIRGRDWRYRATKFVEVGAKQRFWHLYVWRGVEGPQLQRLYLGPLCGRCKRPDPKVMCCCDRPLPQRCQTPGCPRCAQA